MVSVYVIGRPATTVALSGPLSIDGGLSQSPYFVRFLAQLCQRPIAVSDFAERTALGAAQLAALAIGAPLAQADARAILIPPGAPMPAWLDRFDEGLSRARNWWT